jgi:hypothetical protein
MNAGHRRSLPSEAMFFTWKSKYEFIPVLNQVQSHEDVLEEWKYSSMHSKPRYWMEVGGHFHAPTALPHVEERPVNIE